jgi:hypothetical protein
MSKIAFGDEATFKMNGTANRHICVYWAPENPNIHMENVVKFPALTVWFRVSLGHSFLEEQLLALRTSTCFATFILTAIHQLYGNEPFYFQQDGAPPHYH